ncbi:anti-sigma factor [Promicromonospora iranensis]|uniref:Regulator of SigK n=1 Tax=Promicromonospora iranensis TaxID=1105144 RepID=A0ABU2CGN6_9MICO|nr:anti-sigma factor [Promicromonospora iranensis]MDR7380498.1 anti-sigma-K factor RskA [Promicromonospora iranensis]
MSDETSTGARSLRSGAWDLLPGYAMEALDDLDRRAVERLVESDADARRAVDEYHEVVAAFTVETEPPAGLRASVLERVRSTPQYPVVSPHSVPPPVGRTPGADARATVAPDSPQTGAASGDDGDVVDLAARRRPRRWGMAAVAVAAAAAIAVPTTIAVQVTAEREQLREQSEIVSEMLADPDASLVRGAVEGGGEASVLVADGDMLFRAENLPAPDPGRAYQLWVVAADGSVSSAGVLSVTDGETTSLVRGSDGVGMAVSVEPESGSEQPTSDPVLVLST